MSSDRSSRDIRASLSHPVIDVDGHQIEFEPLMLEYLREVGGSEFVTKSQVGLRNYFGWYQKTPTERRTGRVIRPPWGLQTTRPDDIAMCMAPAMFRKHMDETGIDYALVYPTLGVGFVRFAPNELRSAVCRAINRFYADNFRDHADRLTPAAMIPMTTPEEAIAELDYAINELKLKAVMIDCAVPRQIEDFADVRDKVPPHLARVMTWLDSFGVDSQFDYDPFWKRCLELGVSPTAHMAGMWGTRTSISSYAHNHIGMFGAAGEALCKSLFLSGVTFRFPELHVALLEGGAGWACSLYSDLIEHWEKRNLTAIEDYDPKKLDKDRLVRQLKEYGGERYAKLLDRPLEESCQGLFLLSGWVPEAGWEPRDNSILDEFSRCPIKSKEDLRDHFVPNFFFGCEAEDPSVGWAQDGKSLSRGAKLQVIFGSDIGHWDVTDMRGVLAEAHELLEDGHVTPDGFRAFTFANAVWLHGRHKPDFFKGTVIEKQAAAELRARGVGV